VLAATIEAAARCDLIAGTRPPTLTCLELARDVLAFDTGISLAEARAAVQAALARRAAKKSTAA
jgi:hypothetical protein